MIPKCLVGMLWPKESQKPWAAASFLHTLAFVSIFGQFFSFLQSQLFLLNVCAILSFLFHKWDYTLNEVSEVCDFKVLWFHVGNSQPPINCVQPLCFSFRHNRQFLLSLHMPEPSTLLCLCLMPLLLLDTILVLLNCRPIEVFPGSPGPSALCSYLHLCPLKTLFIPLV